MEPIQTDATHLPSQTEFYGPTLATCMDEEAHHCREIRALLSAALNLTEADLSVMDASGKRSVFRCRTSWAISKLVRCGFLEPLGSARYRITQRGVMELKRDDGVEEVNRLVAMAEAERRRQQRMAQGSAEPVEEKPADQSPCEVVDTYAELVNEDAGQSAFDRLVKEGRENARFFESACLRLLEKMGYGAGRLTPSCGDGGVDGILEKDARGTQRTLMQAKCYGPTRNVCPSEIREFLGALGDTEAGIFITAGHFSGPARDTADAAGHRLSLIDGDELKRLLVEYGVGTVEDRTVRLMRVDEEFFETA